MDWKKNVIFSGVVLLIIATSFLGGCQYQKSKLNGTIGEYQDSINRLGRTIEELRSGNTDIIELNRTAGERIIELEGELDDYINRLGKAEGTLENIGADISEAGNTTSGLISAITSVIEAIREYEELE